MKYDVAAQLKNKATVIPIAPPKIKVVRTAKTVRKKGVKEDAAVLVNAALTETNALQRIEETKVVPRQIYENAVEQFVEMVGGRDRVIDVLLLTPPELQYSVEVHKLVTDADSSVTPIADLAVKHRIPIASLVRAYKAALLLKVEVEAVNSIALHAAVVAQQTAEDAQNKYSTCSKCRGTGRVSIIQGGEFLLTPDGDRVMRLCFECDGSGEVFKEHSAQDRSAVLRTIKIGLEDKPQTVVNVNNKTANLNYTPGDGAGESLMKAVHRILHQNPKDVVDVEVISVEGITKN